MASRRAAFMVALTGLAALGAGLLAGSAGSLRAQAPASGTGAGRPAAEAADLLARGRYLATIGVCEACHTPPKVPAQPPPPGDEKEIARERDFRTNPDWKQYLDESRVDAGGVPFILRFSPTSSGVVYSRNITPDVETGIGGWSVEDIVKALRTGETPDGRVLFLFAPHTFFAHLADSDAKALAVYLKSLQPVRNRIPDRQLPFPPQPAAPVPHPADPPMGPSPARAEYLLAAVVGCKECHSHHENGVLQEFTGGDPKDAFVGVFRLGPDLPLRTDEKGFAAFPYPGNAVLYGGNLTKFGVDGPSRDTSVFELMRAMRRGIAVEPDQYGRPRPLEHIMLWQFYSQMTASDAYSIASLVKRLHYVPHDVPQGPIRFGEDWRAAFKQVYGTDPSPHDAEIFGKHLPN